MAAPSGTTWGSKVGDYGRIGLYTSLSSTTTKTTLTVQIWFWSKYSVSDTNNTLYYNNRETTGSATTSKGSVSISTSHDSGSGWSTTNQKKLKTYEVTYDRGASAKTRYLYAKLANVDRVGGTMYVSKSVSIPKLPTYTITYNANGGSGAPAAHSYTYATSGTTKLSATKPTRSGYTFLGWSLSNTATSASYSAGQNWNLSNANNYTLYAVWRLNTYTITYNANDGSGQPANQTKTHGQTLVLSTTKPTRAGYDFLGWSTSSTATSASYGAGSNYTSNAAATLYAVWRLKTYTVTFNANGGTVTPASLTKTHGVALTLTPVPTKPDYNFLGWATSATATTVSYLPGSNYTSEAAITLYAVWELAYVAPKITNVTVTRCDGDKNPTETGTYALVSFDWEIEYGNGVAKGSVSWEQLDDGTNAAYSFIAGNSMVTSDHQEVLIGDGEFSIDKTYVITISVSDDFGNSKVIITLPSSIFTIDMLGGGKGVAFGKQATEENVADFAFNIKARNSVEMDDTLAVEGETTLKKHVHIGEKAGYFDGKTGIYMNPAGYMHVQRSEEDGNPYIAFLRGDATDFQGTILLNENETMSFADAGGYKFDNTIYLDNGCFIQAKNTSGTYRNLATMNASNQMTFGNGSYVGKEGATYFDGNAVNIRSNGHIYMTAPSAGLSARAYGVNELISPALGAYMNASQTVSLTKAISAQPHGIVLVWSLYGNDSSHNNNWNSFFVPKQLVASHGGTSFSFFLVRADLAAAAQKSLIIEDTKITGVATNNQASATSSGITNAPNSFVLRYVYGV